MEPRHYPPPLSYDRYMNRMLPFLQHNAPAPFLLHSAPAPTLSIPPTYFEEPQSGPFPPELPPRSPPIPAKTMADSFGQPIEAPSRWVNPEPDPAFVGLPPPDCSPMDPVFAGMMGPPMMRRSMDEGFNGGYFPGGEMTYDDPYLPRMGPATLRAWNMARLRSARMRKSCWDTWRPCQYIGVFVFLCVLAVIGYAVYNGVIAAIKYKGDSMLRARRNNVTHATTPFTFTSTPIPRPPAPPRVPTAPRGPAPPVAPRGPVAPWVPVPTTTTTTTTAEPVTPPKPAETTTVTKRVRKVKPKKSKKKKGKKTEAAYCSYPVYRLMRVVISGKDDGRCRDMLKGVYPSDTSCKGFHVCFTGGRLIRTGTCPCGRFYHEESRSCQKQKNGYFRNPTDCQRYTQCRLGKGGIVIRQTLRCNAGFAFDTSADKPICKAENEVPGCGAH